MYPPGKAPKLAEGEPDFVSPWAPLRADRSHRIGR
jgi:hypothetical protein